MVNGFWETWAAGQEGKSSQAHGQAPGTSPVVQPWAGKHLLLEAGIAIARNSNPSVDLFGTGDMGIRNTTSAIAAVFCGRPAIR